MNTKKNTGLFIAAVCVIVIIGALVWANHAPASPFTENNSATYVQKEFGFSVQYPSDWIRQDNLTANTCCLFIAHWLTSTSTVQATSTGAKNATSTGTKTVVTEKQLVKLQIGYYDRAEQDPFKAASTTPVTLNGKTFYTADLGAESVYLLPRNDNEGVGIALFRYAETSEEDMSIAKKIIGSITLLNKPVATSTPASATSTPKK